MKKLLCFFIITVLAASVLGTSGCSSTGQNQADAVSETSAQKFDEAMRLYEDGMPDKALEAFRQVDVEDQTHYPAAREKIDELTHMLFEMHVNRAGEYYADEEFQLAISSLETALEYKDSQPVRSLLEHYKNTERASGRPVVSPKDMEDLKKKMLTYEGGTGKLKIALDNIYTREFSVGGIPVQVSGNTVFLKLWVNIINEGEKEVQVKPEYIKLYTSDDTDYSHHPEYSKHLESPFPEILLPPNGRISGRVLVLIPLESSYRFEYDDGTNRVEKTVIPY
jgi:tetratricopeptide (TPR) repeat protein